MTILKNLLIIVGTIFILFGFLTYFRKQYNLINGFEEAYKAGRKNICKESWIDRIANWNYHKFIWNLYDYFQIKVLNLYRSCKIWGFGYSCF